MVPVLVQMYYGWFVQQVAELVARMCIPMYPVFFSRIRTSVRIICIRRRKYIIQEADPGQPEKT
jgi:hypothetical protein